MQNFIKLLLVSSFGVSNIFTNIFACDISGLDKEDVVRALFEKAKPLLGASHYQKNHMLSDQDIEAIQSNDWYINYLYGRCMKVNLLKSTFETRLYNQDNGPNSAETIIAELRKTTTPH